MLSPSVAPAASSRLAGDLAAALDPVRFAERLGVIPDTWQADVLRSDDKRMLLNCSRQSGKSTTTALVGLHTAIYQPNSTIVILSPSDRQSGEFFRTLSDLYTRMGNEVPAESQTKRALELENGSRVLSLPASERTIRGIPAVALLLIDEASRVEDGLYSSVRPMLAVTNGRLIALSTPFGKRGWWSDAWHSNQAWKRVEVPATLCPRISPEFLAEERRTLGDWWFNQEYLCRFMDSEAQVFTSSEIEAAFSEEFETWTL